LFCTTKLVLYFGLAMDTR